MEKTGAHGKYEHGQQDLAERRLADAKISHQVANGWPTDLTVTIRVTMDARQRRHYAAQYDLGDDPEGQAAAARDVRDHLAEELRGVLVMSHTLRKFTSYEISEPKNG